MYSEEFENKLKIEESSLNNLKNNDEEKLSEVSNNYNSKLEEKDKFEKY